MQITFTTSVKVLTENEKKSIEALNAKVDKMVAKAYHKEHRPGGDRVKSMNKIRQGERIKKKANRMRLAGKTYTKTKQPTQLKLNFVYSKDKDTSDKEGMGFLS